MTFRTGITGLNAAQKNLEAIGNNIANSATVGFKASRTEFADVFPTSQFGGASNTAGQGVKVVQLRQNFTQGTVSFTNRNLDMAVSGKGFFRLSDSGSISYTRDGAFGLDQDGYIVSSTGFRLTGFQADANNNITGALGDLKISTDVSNPKTTTAVTLNANLDAGDAVMGAAAPPLVMGAAVLDPNTGLAYVPPRFLPPDPNSYNHTTSYTVYDSLGTAHTATMYFRKTAANTWTSELSVDNQAFEVPAAGTGLAFDGTGVITAPAGPPLGQVAYANVAVSSGAAAMNFTLDLSNLTQFGSPFGASQLNQDGYSTGQLTGVNIGTDGTITGTYSNGQTLAQGQVVLTSFSNEEGLIEQGNSLWIESGASGSPLVGKPGSSSLGTIQGGALEDSNVDLTKELVELIVAQRNFQANAQVISTANRINQTIVQLR